VNGFARFAEIAGGKHGVLPVPAVEQQNVCVAMKLAMLEAIVEQMDEGTEFLTQKCNGCRIPFGQQACIVAPWGYINWDAASRDQKRLVAELFRGSGDGDSHGELALAPVSPGEHIHLKAAPRERIGKRNGQRRFACAAGGKVANADHGIAQTPDWISFCAQAHFAEPLHEPVGWNQG
jgi:hypothetical protein